MGTGGTRVITATVIEGGSDDVLWYVNDIMGGNATVGTVTQTNPTTYTAPSTLPNPATYTAPDEVPMPDSVRVVAVARDNAAESDTCVVKVVMTTIHVDAGTGSDDTGVGMRFSGNSDALLEGCTIEDNGTGIYLCCYQSATHNPVPDLGGGARGSTGGNTIRNNDTCGLESYSGADIFARYNTWANDPPLEGEDFCVGGTGDIIVE